MDHTSIQSSSVSSQADLPGSNRLHPKQFPSKACPDYLAGFLSFVVPGLGQAIQGRLFKAGLFFLCLNFLFYYGWFLGKSSNVYLPRAAQCPPFESNWVVLPLNIPLPKSVYYRWQYLGQAGMGLVVWPAILQCYWADEESQPEKWVPLLGKYLKAVPEKELNRLQTEGDASWELAWVFTVAAGLLNILVIYDAFCGPAVILIANKSNNP